MTTVFCAAIPLLCTAVLLLRDAITVLRCTLHPRVPTHQAKPRCGVKVALQWCYNGVTVVLQ
jgi:hypothetical protein